MIDKFKDGIAICGDLLDPLVIAEVKSAIADLGGNVMIHTDPPYGGILAVDWDKNPSWISHTKWMTDWTRTYNDLLETGDAFYVWGGVGTHCNRSFFLYLAEIELSGDIKIQNIITWGKKRGIGTAYNYLFTREELAFMLKGGKNVKPTTFNVPLLDTLRGYEGYNKKYPAKSAFKRRTNVWTDVTEILRGKVHTAQKALRVCEIPIETSSNPGDIVIDMFAGSGQTAVAARKLGRKFIIIEKDKDTYEKMVYRLSAQVTSTVIGSTT